jgi:hypothetical protein
MKKVLVGLFAIIILAFGILGYTEMNNDTNEIVDENSHSTTIKL